MKTLMRSLAVAATVAAASVGATAANAATLILVPQNDGLAGSFETPNGKKGQSFSFNYDVTLPESDATDVQLGITGGFLSSATFGLLGATSPQGLDIATNKKSASFSFGSLAAGTYRLAFAGGYSGPGKITGSIGVTPAAVPEPASWALMIGGVGIVGGAMRRRQRTTVSFA